MEVDRLSAALLTSCAAVCSSSFETSMACVRTSAELLLMSVTTLISLVHSTTRLIWSMSALCAVEGSSSVGERGGAACWSNPIMIAIDWIASAVNAVMPGVNVMLSSALLSAR